MPFWRWKSISRVKRPALASCMAFWMVACGTWQENNACECQAGAWSVGDRGTNNLLERGLVVDVQPGVLVDTTVGLLGLIKRLIHNKLHDQVGLLEGEMAIIWRSEKHPHAEQSDFFSPVAQQDVPSSSRPG
jgi:hypothetical protein